MKKQWGGHNRLEGSQGKSPLLVLRVPAPLLQKLKAVAATLEKKPSALAREILEKALDREGRSA